MCVCKVHTCRRRKGRMRGVLPFRVSSFGSSPAPASSQGGVFPISMPVLSISVCRGIQVGVYPLHTRHALPISFSLSRDSFTLDRVWSYSRVSVFRYFSSSLHSPPFCLIPAVLFLRFHASQKTPLLNRWVTVTVGDAAVFSLCYSCTGSTGSSWGALPDGRLPVCWQRDNGGDKPGSTPRPLPAKGMADDIITLWPWSRITATPLLPRNPVRTPNAKVTDGDVES